MRVLPALCGELTSRVFLAERGAGMADADVQMEETDGPEQPRQRVCVERVIAERTGEERKRAVLSTLRLPDQRTVSRVFW